RTRARQYLGTAQPHERPAVGLLLVTAPHHEDCAVHSVSPAGHRERAAPLSRARAGYHLTYSGPVVIIGLRQRRIKLVAARRARALMFEVDVSRRAKSLLEPSRTIQRGWPPPLIFSAYRIGNRNETGTPRALPVQRQRQVRSYDHAATPGRGA